MLKKEYELLKPFAEEPWKKLTFKQIEIASKKKSKSYVFNILKKFVKENVLREEKIGNVQLYSINFDSMKALAYIGFVAEYVSFGKKNIPVKDLEKIASKIPANFYTLIITGSYAKGKQKAGSDLDLVIICDDSLKPDKIYSEIRYDCEMNIPPIHLYVFRNREYIEMLSNKEANYGKEIARNNLILAGGQIHLKLISEAMQNGFNG